ncbi:hypothetical protein GG344DRAFT_77121 [Lentinula edodes]|nr:hypothetical protein GG344DRAFT_77121 [Lentinula edodes]
MTDYLLMLFDIVLMISLHHSTISSHPTSNTNKTTTIQNLTLDMLLRICLRFGDGRKTVMIMAQICREMNDCLSGYLYTNVTERDIEVLARRSIVGQQFGRVHRATFVQHISFSLPIITVDAKMDEIRNALNNVAFYRYPFNVFTFRFVHPTMTIADVFLNHVPPPFRKLRTINVCGASAHGNQSVATTLMVIIGSNSLKDRYLQTVTYAVDYFTLSKWLSSLAERSPNLETLSLRIDSRLVFEKIHKVQEVFDSTHFTFKRLKHLDLDDPRALFKPTSFFNRHSAILQLRYVSNPFRNTPFFDSISLPILTDFTGWVVHATSLIHNGSGPKKSLTLKGQQPSAIEWYDFLIALRTFRNVTVLHMRDSGGYLFRHIQTVTPVVPQLESMSFSLCSHWKGWMNDCKIDIFQMLFHALLRLRKLALMTCGRVDEVLLAFTSAVLDRPSDSAIEEVRVYGVGVNYNPNLLIVEWYKAPNTSCEPEYYIKEYDSLLQSHDSRSV